MSPKKVLHVSDWGQKSRRGMDQSVIHLLTFIKKRCRTIMSLIIYFVFPAISVTLNIKYPWEATAANVHYAQNDRLRSCKSDRLTGEEERTSRDKGKFICMKYCRVCWSMSLGDYLEAENVTTANHSVCKFLHFPWGGKKKKIKLKDSRI